MRWLAIFVAVLLGVAIGRANAQPPPPGYEPIPPPRHELVPPPPNARVTWEPGHWHWNGVRYIWITGHYIERPVHFGHYVNGHWVWSPREQRWAWRPAHWE